MKLWHDDIRLPPDDTWEWARTNQDAIKLLELNHCTEASLDHDLGLHNADPHVVDADMQQGWDQENDGYDLVKWMCENNKIPDKVTIHSWNPPGAKKMALLFRDYGVEAVVKPYHTKEDRYE